MSRSPVLRRLASTVSLVLSLSAMCVAQSNTQASTGNWNDQIQQMSFLNRAKSEYRLGAGDLVEVSVYGVDDYRYDLRLNSSGNISLPLLGAVSAAGRTPAELELDLKRRFEAGLIKNAQVTVFVKEYRSQPVFVLGAVRQPGQYQMVHQLNLVDVLAMAGGLEIEKADDYALIQRPSGENKASAVSLEGTTPELKTNVLRIDLKALLEDGDVALNVPIQGGDVIQVPVRKVELVYVIGDVGKPGAFEIPREYDVYVTQALASAGGPLRTAKLSAGIIVRYDGAGGRQEMTMDFDKIIKGKSPDIPLRPNDIIFVPGSTAKTIGYSLLGAIPGIVSGSIIWGVIQ